MQLFVLGAPRSGTTLVGRYLASHPDCLDLGEYYAFFLAYSQAPRLMSRLPSPVKDAYLENLAENAANFAVQRQSAKKKAFWCDQTPWNLLVADSLRKLLPRSVFVLMLRDFRGVILSLRDSYQAGYQWAGRNVRESALLWARFYQNASHLPTSRTITVSYDALCATPDATITALDTAMARFLPVDGASFDKRVFAARHAQNANSAAPIATMRKGILQYAPRPSFDKHAWTEEMEFECAPLVATVQQELESKYGITPWSSSSAPF
jgi:Sulfotransferase family